MNNLLKIGFIKVGVWSLYNSHIQFSLTSHVSEKGVLYSFVSNNEIKYIGKTTQTLSNRMKGYQKPGSTLRTNIRVKDKITNLLGHGLPLEIYILPDDGLFKFGDFKLSVAAGLEDTLINEFNPEWNITGRKKENRIDKIVKKEKILPQIRSQNFTTDTIEVILWPAYYNQGFFNVRRRNSDRFGKDQEIIRILLGDNSDNIINGVIDRKANSNGTPRIRGRKELTEWIQSNFKPGDILLVDIISPVSIRLRKV